MGEKPDGITFLGVLSACVHMGLIEGGFRYFRLMTKKYLIEPSIEHYGCLIDLLGRAGFLNEVVEFMKKMSIKPDYVIWSSLLGACQVPNSVVLSNLYGEKKRWVEAARMKKMARESSLGRSPGCSLVEVNCQVVEFFSSDTGHPQMEKIFRVLEGLWEISNLIAQEM